MNNNNTHVRYGVHYNDRNYEYALHSGRGKFLKNLADVINIVEYCVTQDLKKNLYKSDEKLYNVNVIRFVNDKVDESWSSGKQSKLHIALNSIIDQLIADNIQRYA